MGVSRHLLPAKGLHLSVHLAVIQFGSFPQIHLIALHGPAANEGGIAGLEVILCGEWFDFAEQIHSHADGSGYEVVIEEMVELSGRWIPSDVPHLARLPLALGVRVAFARVGVI